MTANAHELWERGFRIADRRQKGSIESTIGLNQKLAFVLRAQQLRAYIRLGRHSNLVLPFRLPEGVIVSWPVLSGRPSGNGALCGGAHCAAYPAVALPLHDLWEAGEMLGASAHRLPTVRDCHF